MFEDDADLEAMFSTDDFASAATFTPTGGGSAVDCAVVPDDGVDTASLGIAGISQNNRRLLVRLVEVADPRGGTFTIGAETFRVTSTELDPTGKVWTCFINPTE